MTVDGFVKYGEPSVCFPGSENKPIGPMVAVVDSV